MTWAAVTLAAYEAATGNALTCAGCGHAITAQSAPPEETTPGVFIHPNPRCSAKAPA